MAPKKKAQKNKLKHDKNIKPKLIKYKLLLADHRLKLITINLISNFLITQNKEENYNKEVYQRRESRNKSFIDMNENRQQNYNQKEKQYRCQEISVINKIYSFL